MVRPDLGVFLSLPLAAENQIRLQATEHGDVEARLEEVDVDAMLRFARHLRSQPRRLWADAPAKTKIELQRALFLRGLVVDRALEFQPIKTTTTQ